MNRIAIDRRQLQQDLLTISCDTTLNCGHSREFNGFGLHPNPCGAARASVQMGTTQVFRPVRVRYIHTDTTKCKEGARLHAAEFDLSCQRWQMSWPSPLHLSLASMARPRKCDIKERDFRS